MSEYEKIIRNMAITFNHEYGLPKHELGGMTDIERKFLYNQMKQIFYNDILPHMELKK